MCAFYFENSPFVNYSMSKIDYVNYKSPSHTVGDITPGILGTLVSWIYCSIYGLADSQDNE
jgi:hypothetical protein